MAANNNNQVAYNGPDVTACQESETDKHEHGDGFSRLRLRNVLGFNGRILNGLLVHVTGKHLIYALGRHVILEEITGHCAGRQEMLAGHLGLITALSLSTDGRFVVSGQQETVRENRSPVILWDFCSRRKVMDRALHKEKTAAVAFTSSSRYFVSLGGPDDGTVCVWDTSDKKPLVAKLAQLRRTESATVLRTSQVTERMFVTLGQSYGRVWNFDPLKIKLDFTELAFGNALRRVVSCEIGDKDVHHPPRIFCGTSTGSILCFHGESGVLMIEILTPLFSQGVTALTYVRMMDEDTYCFLVGTGEGKVGHYKIRFGLKGNKSTASMEVYQGTTPWIDPQGGSCVTSISKLGAGQQFYVGLYQSHMHRFTLEPWENKLVRTCSNSPINDAVFARGTDDLLVTAEFEKVRVYNLKVMLEVRRYVRTNRECVSVCMRHDGTHIFTGWDGGDIQVLGFEPNNELGLHVVYKIETAHRQAVSRMVLTSVSDRLVTGGRDGFISVWRLVEDLDQRGRRLRQGIRLFHFVDQKGPITSLRVSSDDQSCVASCLDGSAMVYSLVSGHRIREFTWTCGLTGVTFGQNDLQVVTSSSGGRLQWWDVVTGHLVRDLLGSSTGSVRCTDTEPITRQNIATGGDDKLVKIWHTEKGEVSHVGEGHSGDITLVKFGPCSTVLLSAANDGSICIWDVPAELLQ